MGPSKRAEDKTRRLRTQLLAWYDANRRNLPWRRTTDPYAIWVSEIMLQQTRVAVVIERFIQFLERFPTVDALARAPEQDVLALWSGLGYYRRARMLHRAAQVVTSDLNAKLPSHSNELRKLPGIGTYTAAAIASIAHDEPIAVVDGNVERVLCRLAGLDLTTGVRASSNRRKIEALANHLVDPHRPGDFNQAVMELGATVCLPRSPQCLLCPIAPHCVTRGEHKTTPRAAMTTREAAYALCLRTRRGRQEILLHQRPAAETVMPGMWELPSLTDTSVPAEHVRMTVRHAIMQINYIVSIRDVAEHDIAQLTAPATAGHRWVPLNKIASLPLTGLARKVLTHTNLFHARPPKSMNLRMPENPANR